MSNEELRDLLLQLELLKPEDLETALSEAESKGRSLEKVILEKKLLSLQTLYTAIAHQLGFEYVSLENFVPDGELLKLIPEDLICKVKAIPFKFKDGILHIAMQEPNDLYLVDHLQRQLSYPLEIYLSSPQEIEDVLKRISERSTLPESFLERLGRKDVEETLTLAEGTSTIKLVDLIISQAVESRASDIHIEPEAELTRIRYRIDGILCEIPPPPKEWELAIISRIKVLSGMDIAESRIPQDGHFQRNINNRIVDFRVSTMPTIYGENLVLRLLDTASVLIGLEKLGFSTPEDLKRYEELISKPYGIILSTGPTGSGKTTTLYSALMRINTIERNIVTIEDPVEYRLGLIRQIQVNPKAGITFANGLRAILRQDPDVIMVGEIRDLETAIIAVQAALTGHLVFSTLHTNDSPSAVIRLINMGIEPYLISASLIGVMSQRLVRLICQDCKEEYQPSVSVLKRWNLEDRKDIKFFRGRGCQRCRGTGYRGRTGIFELMVVDDEIREMISSGATTVALRKKAQEKGMRLLYEDGLEKVFRGITTLEEVSRVTEEYVEIKPELIKPELYVRSLEVELVKKLEGTPVDAVRLEEYERKITSWFARRK